MDRYQLIYDGDCPFCARYRDFVELKKRVNIELTDARKVPDTISRLKEKGFDINRGMILIQNGEQIFHGKFAALKMNELLGDLSFLQNLALKASNLPGVMTILYPVLNTLRKCLLTLIGKNKKL